jgi:nicotinate-nucleotide pyrophosphorylase (carboxylating)
MTPAETMTTTREARLKRALFRGDNLDRANPHYLRAMRAILTELVSSDIGRGDLTTKALGLRSDQVTGRVLAKEPGVVAGLEEYRWLLGSAGIEVTPQKKDGDSIAAGETIVEIASARGALLAYERVGLNFLQRMSGIATATHQMQLRVHRRNPGAHVVGTRKTPWGLLDKRALHLGGGGTHRLGLWDAILVKNNHLALLADSEIEAAPKAIKRAWEFREHAAFIEVEVRSEEAALAAARSFRDAQRRDAREDGGTECACLLLLDNRQPAEAAGIVKALGREGLLETVLLEASGNIHEGNVEEYASSGADAISMGALTHSARSLDICQRIP